VIVGLITSFVLVLFTYEFIGLALEHFLYGKDALVFYGAATLNVTLITALVVLALIMIIGWLFMYKQHFVDRSSQDKKPNKAKWSFYRLLAREGYYFDIFKYSKKGKL
jgi:NADH-quinone oxidoreductase subunit L